MQDFVGAHFATAVPLGIIAFRLQVAATLGALLGFEREWRERPAGLRTHILVCVASATFALIAIEIVRQPIFDTDTLRTDPLRLIEAITGGVAFLAAGMWLAAAVGLASGLGLFVIAGLACASGVITLTLIRRLEVWLSFKEKRKEGYPQDDESEGKTR